MLQLSWPRRIASVLGMLLAALVLFQSTPAASQGASPSTFTDPPTDVVGSVQVSPAANTSLEWPPREIKLSFQSGIAPTPVQVTLVDDEGLRYPPALGTTTNGADVVFNPPSLPAGVYTVSWTGAAADSYRFAVTTGNAEELGPTESSNVAQTSAAIDPEGSNALLKAIMLFSITALTGVIVFRYRPRRTVVGLLVIAVALSGVYVLRPTSTFIEGRQRCLKFSGDPRLDCLAAVALERYDVGGVAATLAELRSLSSDPLFRPEYGEHVCHSVAHLTARVVVSREGSISKSLANADTLCASGFLHGVIEGGAPLLETPVFADEVKSICGPASDEATFQCAHGIGHATALRLNSRLRESADVCIGLANQQQAVQCVLGASMLYGVWIGNMAARSPDPAQYTPPGSPIGEIGEVCLDRRFTSDPDMFRACLEGMFVYMKSGAEVLALLPRAWSDINEIGSWCAALATSRPELEMACFSSLGSASALRLHESPANMPGVCAAALTDEGVNVCVVALVTKIRWNSSDSPAFSVYETVCSAAPAVAKTACLQTSKRLYEQ
jgi:methionine-rich copper-binding protein CopC